MIKKENKCEINNCNKNMVSDGTDGVPPFCEYHNEKFTEYLFEFMAKINVKERNKIFKNEMSSRLFILEIFNNFKKLYENNNKKE